MFYNKFRAIDVLRVFFVNLWVVADLLINFAKESGMNGLTFRDFLYVYVRWRVKKTELQRMFLGVFMLIAIASIVICVAIWRRNFLRWQRMEVRTYKSSQQQRKRLSCVWRRKTLARWTQSAMTVNNLVKFVFLKRLLR